MKPMRKWMLVLLCSMLALTGLLLPPPGTGGPSVHAEETIPGDSTVPDGGDSVTDAVYTSEPMFGLMDVSSESMDAYEQISPDLVAEYDKLEINDSVIENTAVGSWLRFNNVDFGDLRPGRIEYEVTTDTSAEKDIQVRLDSLEGPILGDGAIIPTGGWSNFEVQSFELYDDVEISGERDIFIIFNQNFWNTGGNFKWFRFIPYIEPTIIELEVTTARKSLNAIGQTTDLQVRGLTDQESVIDLPQGVTPVFQSTDTDVITVDGNGTVTAQRLGMASILVSALIDEVTVTGEIEIRVTDVEDVIFYVSPSGDDEGTGELDDPFRTVAGAQIAVRDQVADGMESDVIVYLREGDYFLDDKIVFTELDSGRDGFTVRYLAYPGEEAVLDGGSLITGWEAVDGNIYKAEVSADWTFGTLSENGERSYIARNPDKGAVREGYLAVAAPMVSASPKTQFRFNEGDIPEGLDPSDGLEVDIWAGGPNGTWNWTAYVRDIVDIDYEQRIVTISEPVAYEMGPGSRYYIRGSKVLLDAPGEFYLDKEENTVYYWPRQLPIENQEILAPKLKRILEFKGASASAPVEHMELAGVTIRNSDYDSATYSGDSGLLVRNARSITIRDNQMHSIGSHGIDFRNFARDIEISGNWIHDIGYYGIQLEGDTNNDMSYNRIVNNLIHGTGKMVGHGQGIRVNHSSHNTVSHNRIFDAPRYAISIKNAGSSYNLIQYNDLFDVNTDSQDTGVIESFRSGTGNIVDHNHVYDSNIHFSFGFGIYLDDATQGYTISNNFIHGLEQSGNGTLRHPLLSKGIGNHFDNNFIVNNHASIGPFGVDQLGADETFDLSLARNIFYNSGNAMYHVTKWTDDRLASSDYQLLYNENDVYGVSGVPGVTDFASWQQALNYKYDQLSMIANPQFMDEPNGDYRLRYNSPAKKLGIQDIDFANMGLLSTFGFADLSDSLSSIYPISEAGLTLASIALAISETTDIHMMGRTTSGYYDDLASSDISYESSDTSVATVNGSGQVTAVGAGVTTVTVTVQRGGEQYTTFLHVIVNDQLETVHLDAARSTLMIGEQSKLHIVGESTYGVFSMFAMDGDDVLVTNHNPEIIQIDAQGNLQALAPGTATVEVAVTLDGITKTGEGFVEVLDPIDAYAWFGPEQSSTRSGLTVDDTLIGNTAPGSWVLFPNVDFGEVVPNHLVMDAAIPSTHTGNVVEVRVDSLTGPLLGTITLGATADWLDFQEQTAALDGDVDMKGVHHVYLIFPVDNDDRSGDFKALGFERIPVPPAAPWKVVNYGDTTGTVDAMDGKYTIVSNGANIWGAADEFTYMYQDIPAAVANRMSITATVESLYQTHADSGSGVMIRAKDEAGSYNAVARVRASGGGLRFTYRNDDRPETWYQTGANILFPATVKLVREDDLFTGYYLNSSEEWEQFAQISVEMSGDVTAGIAVFSQHADPTESVVSNIIIETEEPVSAGQAELSGPDEVTAGDPFTVTYSLVDVASDVYAKSVIVHYDPERLSYVSAESLLEDVMVEDAIIDDGQIKLVLAGMGADAGMTGTMDILELNFETLPVSDNENTLISLSDVIVSDQYGNTTALDAGPDYELQIVKKIVVKTALTEKITEARAALNGAQISETLFGHYSEAAADALESAILEAQSAANQADISQEDVDLATETLDTALQTFVAAVNTTVGIGDLGVMAYHYLITSDDTGWATVAMYDLNENGELDIYDLAQIARQLME